MYEDRTYENIKKEILAGITLADKREGSFVQDMISPIALAMEGEYAQFERMLGILFVEDSAGEYLDKKAAEYGMERKDGTKATGSVVFSGTAGKVVPAGTLVGTENGLLFLTEEEVTLSQDGSGTVGITAEAAGEKYNVAQNTITSLPVAVQSVTAVTNPAGTAGGTERENDVDFSQRILLYLQTPATSGNVYHYRQWAMEVDGVGDAKVFPLDNGPGTVTVLPLTSAGRAPDTGMIQAVKQHIEENRPIGATVTVTAPEEVGISVTAKVQATGITQEVLQKEYEQKLDTYLRESVFTTNSVDYYKLISMLYEIAGVTSVAELTVNGGTATIPISDRQIQVKGTVTVEVAA